MLAINAKSKTINLSFSKRTKFIFFFFFRIERIVKQVYPWTMDGIHGTKYVRDVRCPCIKFHEWITWIMLKNVINRIELNFRKTYLRRRNLRIHAIHVSSVDSNRSLQLIHLFLFRLFRVKFLRTQKTKPAKKNFMIECSSNFMRSILLMFDVFQPTRSLAMDFTVQ